MTRYSSPRVDAHTHFFYDRAFLGPLFDALNLRVVVINLTADGFFHEAMEARWKAMRALKETHPDRVILCTTFDPEIVVRRSDGAEQVVRRLKEHVRQGAATVKVWKDLGLTVRDEGGGFVQVDDRRFQPIWDFLAGEGLPVIAHIAEPRTAWLPLDERSPHYRFYRDHPEHHLYGREDVPSWEALIDARDRWIEANPSLRIVGAHFGSMAHDVSEVSRRLEAYDNFFVDTAERFADLVVQPSDRVRSLFIAHADRILYGTDVIVDAPPGAPLDEARVRAEYEALLEDHRRYLGGKGAVEVKATWRKPVTVHALDLPPHVLDKIYHENATRLFE